MSRMTIAFRVDADSQIGMGHLMRCCVLAAAFYQRGCRILFVSCGDTMNFMAEAPGFNYECIDLSSRAILGDYARIESSYAITHWILDTYSLSGVALRALRGVLKAVLVLLDDENNRGPLSVDIVLNSSLAANNLDYDLSASACLRLLGPQYSLLRGEFLREATPVFRDRRYCLITMGGADPLGLTLPLLQTLIDQQVIMPIVVVTGQANPQAGTIAQYVKGLSSVIHRHAVTTMADLMRSSRLAIAAAGSTIAELGIMQVPSLLCVVADNQWPAAMANKKHHWCEVYDCRRQLPLREIVEKVCQLWCEPDLLENMSLASRNLYSLDGSGRVVDEVLGYRK